MGIVKNRFKNGARYWVDACVTPLEVNGEIIVYESVRVHPNRAFVERAETVYRRLQQGKSADNLSQEVVDLTQNQLQLDERFE